MKNITDFEDFLKEKYGEKGTTSRDKYDTDSLAFRLGVMLKDARNEDLNISIRQLNYVHKKRYTNFPSTN